MKTRTFPYSIKPTTTTGINEVFHLRSATIDPDDELGIYLEAIYCNGSLASFQLFRFPDFDGDETEAEKLAKFTSAENASQKFGLKLLTRKSGETGWREKAEIIMVNRGRKDYFDLLNPYLAQRSVRILEQNDEIAIQLVDYGYGLLKDNDFLELEFAIRIESEKKNNEIEQLRLDLETLKLAIDGRLTELPANTLLGRDTTTGTVQQIPQSRFAKPSDIDTAIFNLIGSAPEALNTLDELAQALSDDANFATTITNSLAQKAPLVSPTFTGPVSGITATMVGLGNLIDSLQLAAGSNLSDLANRQTALNNIAGPQTANRVLRSNGTNVLLGQINLATDVTGSLPIANGGTNSATQNFVDLASNQTIGGAKTFTSIVVAPSFSADTTGRFESSTAVYDRKCLSFNLYSSSTATLGYRYQNIGFGCTLELLPTGQVRFRLTPNSGAASGAQVGAFVTPITIDVNETITCSKDFIVNGTTASTSTATGALTVGGGIGTAGAIFAGSSIQGTQFQVAGIKVIGARNLGWTAPTGTTNKGAFSSDTATLLEVSRRLYTLENALRSHGLIGT
ncbi:hypothetical protein QUB04_09485 [Microcoleus sp. D2_18a_B4]